METLERYLSEHAFFQDIEPAYLKILVGCASNVKFQPSEFLFHCGEEANSFYLIRHGRVSVELFAPNRGAVTIQTLGPGDLLGWSWLIPPYRWHYDAKALELVRAIALDGKCLRNKCESDHSLGYDLMKRVSYILNQRLEATSLQLLDVYGYGK